MKISGDRESIYYWPLYFSKCPVILLNGKAVSNVTFVDDEAGVVEMYILDERGKPRKANIVLEDGTLIETVTAKRKFNGKVNIIGASHDETSTAMH